MGNVLKKKWEKQAVYDRKIFPSHAVFSPIADFTGFTLCFAFMNLLDNRRGFE